MDLESADVLDLGCGLEKVEGAFGVDHPDKPDKLTEADFRHNLGDTPYPWNDNSVSKIYLKDVLEHLESPLKVIEECYRMLEDGGKLVVEVPQSDPPRTNPFHKHEFADKWFYAFDPTRDEWAKGYQINDSVKFKVNIEVDYKFRKKILPLLPLYWIKSLESRFYDFPYGKRQNLKVSMVKIE